MSILLALGTEIAMGNGATPEVFTKIPKPSQISFGNPEKAQVDVTNHDSLDEEFIQGLGSAGECTFTLFWDSTEPQQVAIRDKVGVTNPTNFQLTLPDDAGTVFDFAATVNTTWTFDEKDALKLEVTLNISGAVTYTP
jgi:hypothetical protein